MCARGVREYLTAGGATAALTVAGILAAVVPGAMLAKSAVIDTVRPSRLEQAFDGAYRGDIRELDDAIRAGVSIEAVNESKAHLVEAAAASNRVDAVRYLLDHGARIETGGYVWGGAVGAAAEFGNADVLRELLKRGARPDTRGQAGRVTPLFMAAHCTGQSGEPVRLLLKAGANPNLQMTDGRTPLMEAAEVGEEPSVRLLLAAGADPKLRDHAGQTAAEIWKAHFGEVPRVLAEAE